MFQVAAEAYDAFMGRYSRPLAPVFCDFAGVEPGDRVLDVGCGPGALTAELVRRLGASSTAAVDPSEPFAAAARRRFPGVDVQLGTAEQLPFDDGAFDGALAQLVVHFMADPAAGIVEMARVARPDGFVAACVWDHAGRGGPLSRFWELVRELDPNVPNESERAGTGPGQLADLLRVAGLGEVDETLLSIEVEHATFDDWWEPFTLGVGPAGAYVAALDPDGRERLREHCRAALLDGALVVRAGAWAARGRTAQRNH